MNDTIKNIIVKVLEGAATHEEHVALKRVRCPYPNVADRTKRI